VTQGLVNFCDATATYCEDVHILGAAQLTSAGTAVFKFRPAVGNHSYKAVFVGTTANAGSSSSVSSLAVTGAPFPTITTIAQSGSATAGYTLTATVAGAGNVVPTGTVSFLNTSGGDAVLGTGVLGSPNVAFLNPSSPATVSNPGLIATGDFNGDGIPDLAVASTSGGAMTIVLGNGDGTFTTTPTVPSLSTVPAGIAVGDFNGDGKLDLAVLVYGAGGETGTGNVDIFLGNGDGTFQSALVSPATGDEPAGIAVGDFNQDGIPDLAIPNKGSDTVTVLLGNGDGTFTATAVSPATGQQPFEITVGDFNGDGMPGLAVGNEGGLVTILLGNGDGTFTAAPVSPTIGTGAFGLVAVDFNGDGIPDLAVVNTNNPQSYVLLLIGEGHGTFRSGATVATAGYEPQSMVVGDFNGDGVPDLAVTDELASSGSSSYNGVVTVLLGNGDGSFTSTPVAPAGDGPKHLVTADFAGIGASGVATSNLSSKTVTVLTPEQTATTTASAIVMVPPDTGSMLVEASYSGNSLDGPSVSLPVALAAGLAAPILTLTASPAGSVVAGQPVTLTATLNPYTAAGGEYTTNGLSVVFSVDIAYHSETLGSANLSGGVATLTTAAIPVATYVPYPASGGSWLGATFSGSQGFQAAGDEINYVVVSALAPPTITSVSPIAPQQTQTITISGSGFGTQSAYNGDSNYILFADPAGIPPWYAGNASNPVTLSVSSWSDTQIVITGFTGQYGTDGMCISPGDQLYIKVWNTQTGNGPAYYPITASSGTNTCVPGPKITSVSAILPQQTQTITITGSGFGTQSAYTGDSSDILFADPTGTAWYAGDSRDAVSLSVTSWSDTQIVLSGFTGQYGTDGMCIKPGDQVYFKVWNAQTGSGPAYYPLTVGGGTNTCVPGPNITSVSAILPQQTQTITINGSGFGTQTAYNGDSKYILFADPAGTPWYGGYPGDAVTLSVSSWTDSQIVITGFTGAYGTSAGCIKPGDQLYIRVWNPQTGSGPSYYPLTAGSGTNTCP
jgi:protein involved in polysaccharide export with SLBB domain